MPARTLYQTAVHWLVKNKEGIDDVGDIPYEKIRPVLLKIERPDQLASIEKNSPQLLGKTAEIWRAFLLRDIQDYDQRPVEPRDGKSWWKTYRKAKQRADEEQERQEDELVSQLMARKEERDRNTTTVSSKLVVPGADRRKSRQAMAHSRTGDSSRLLFGGGTRTKTNTGAGVMKQVKREMAERQTRLHSLGAVPQRTVPRPKPPTKPTQAAPLPLLNQTASRPSASAASGGSVQRQPHKPLAPSRNPRLAAMASATKRRSPSPNPKAPLKSSQPAHQPSSAHQQSQVPPNQDERASPPKRKPPTSSVFMPSKKRK